MHRFIEGERTTEGKNKDKLRKNTSNIPRTDDVESNTNGRHKNTIIKHSKQCLQNYNACNFKFKRLFKFRIASK